MPARWDRRLTHRTDALSIAGVGVLAVFCCAALPVVVAFVGGLTIGALLGGGLFVCVLVGATAALVVRVRRRRACSPTATGRTRP